jgi:hypothetical protein
VRLDYDSHARQALKQTMETMETMFAVAPLHDVRGIERTLEQPLSDDSLMK